MFYNIKPLIFALCFHGIRFKVNKDWLSGIDSLLFFIYLSTLFLAAILHHSSHLWLFYPLFID
ncbi:hypothetical protein DXA83_04845 [Bacteroides thetaiotaomicron]|nr:hypothetical protein DXA83_04845 [Bacteroides thetaiotaomicron]